MIELQDTITTPLLHPFIAHGASNLLPYHKLTHHAIPRWTCLSFLLWTPRFVAYVSTITTLFKAGRVSRDTICRMCSWLGFQSGSLMLSGLASVTKHCLSSIQTQWLCCCHLASIFSEKPADEGDDTGIPLFMLAATHFPESWPVSSLGLC